MKRRKKKEKVKIRSKVVFSLCGELRRGAGEGLWWRLSFFMCGRVGEHKMKIGLKTLTTRNPNECPIEEQLTIKATATEAPTHI